MPLLASQAAVCSVRLREKAVDDPRMTAMLALNERQQLIAGLVFQADPIADIGSIKSWRQRSRPRPAADSGEFSARVRSSAVAVSASRGTFPENALQECPA